MPIKIINGKQYLVWEDKDGNEIIMGNPMKDQAKAIAKEMNKQNNNTTPTTSHSQRPYCKEEMNFLKFGVAAGYAIIILVTLAVILGFIILALIGARLM